MNTITSYSTSSVSNHSSEWFGEWFNSPYYHILYQDRNDEEARFFIDNLTNFLELLPSHKVLDLACGKGRHAVYLNQKGLDVIGADLSEENIHNAQAYSNDRLQFIVHDMREVIPEAQFDFIFNLFTSFGYFDDAQENIKTLHSISQMLRQGATLVIDFLNPVHTVQQLVPYEIKHKGGIDFHITKQVQEGFVVKDIRFEDASKAWHFQERVRLLDKATFETYFAQVGLDILQVFGDYSLNSYDEKSSERMIFIVRKC